MQVSQDVLTGRRPACAAGPAPGRSDLVSDRPESSILKSVTNTYLLDGLRDAGNRIVWQTFVDRYRPMIEKYAYRFGVTGADAQDAAQQTLIAFATSYQQGKYQRDRGRLRVWLFGIARNQILNTRKKRAHREVQVAGANDETDFFAQQGDEDQLEAIWEQEWRDAVLRQCLEEVRQEFDAKSIEAFELFAWRGWPAQKVADHLDLTANAVFIVKHRVLKRIRELLPKMEEDW